MRLAATALPVLAIAAGIQYVRPRAQERKAVVVYLQEEYLPPKDPFSPKDYQPAVKMNIPPNWK